MDRSDKICRRSQRIYNPRMRVRMVRFSIGDFALVREACHCDQRCNPKLQGPMRIIRPVWHNVFEGQEVTGTKQIMARPNQFVPHPSLEPYQQTSKALVEQHTVLGQHTTWLTQLMKLVNRIGSSCLKSNEQTGTERMIPKNHWNIYHMTLLERLSVLHIIPEKEIWNALYYSYYFNEHALKKKIQRASQYQVNPSFLQHLTRFGFYYTFVQL